MAKLKLGLVVPIDSFPNPEDALDRVSSFGLPTCQVAFEDPALYTREVAGRLRQGADRRGLEITAVWAHCNKGQVWTLEEGPSTIGLVPPATRKAAIRTLKAASDFASWMGVPSIATHAGFIPETPGDPLYAGVVEAIREVAVHCEKNGQSFCFETGQETPVTLLRTIEDAGMSNLGVCFDPANLLAYGKANPLDALEILGPYVWAFHAKDGEYPTSGREFGVEKPIGEGRANFPALMPKLKSLGYSGAVTIEREVEGAEQTAGIQQAIRVLEPLL